MIATTQMKARTTELEHREKLLQEVFAEALNELKTVEQWTNYEVTALKLVSEGPCRCSVLEIALLVTVRMPAL